MDVERRPTYALDKNFRKGDAIRMSWCAFFEEINSRGGGRLFRTGE